MDPVILVISRIIKDQESIVGPVALDLAKHVTGLKILSDADHLTLEDNGKKVIENLVKEYASLFGQASIDVCRDAVKESGMNIQENDLPDILK